MDYKETLEVTGKLAADVYDAASIGNKGVSERLITAPFSPLGQNTRIASRDASCVSLPTNRAWCRPGFGSTIF